MNTQVLIGKNAAINAKPDPSDLTYQEIGIYAVDTVDNDLKLYTNGMSTYSVRIAVGKLGGGVEWSNDFRRGAKLYQLTKSPYLAPVKAQKVVTINVSGANSFDQFELRIVSRGLRYQSGGDEYVETVNVTGIFGNVTALYAAIKVAYDKRTNMAVTILTSGSGIKLTATEDGQIIDAYLTPYLVTEIAYTVTVVDTTTMNPGSGTYQQVLDLANDYAISKGIPYHSNKIYSTPSDSFAAGITATSIIYFIEWSNPTQPKGEHGLVFDVRNQVYLIVPSAMTVTGLDGMLAAAFGSTLVITDPTGDTTTTVAA